MSDSGMGWFQRNFVAWAVFANKTGERGQIGKDYLFSIMSGVHAVSKKSNRNRQTDGSYDEQDERLAKILTSSVTQLLSEGFIDI